MGWLGGSPEGSGDTIDLSKVSAGEYGSKMRSSSLYGGGNEFDTSPDSGASSFSSLSSPGARGSGGDLQQVIALEQQKLQLMSQLHKLNENCWDLCVGSMGHSLSGREETCINNCVERFVDTTMLVTKRFAQLAQKMGGH